MENKRGMQLAISTIVLLVIAMMVLVGMITLLVANWGRFSDTLSDYSGTDKQSALDLCRTQCDLEKSYDFCCSTKKVDQLETNCIDLKVACSNFYCGAVTC